VGFYAFDRLLKEWRDRGNVESLVLGTTGSDPLAEA
jgi:hypothetical protein